jgi:hypothetical protein
MAAGIEIYNYVTNQKGSPALYSDVLANRPAAGYIGRLFISTDTFEIYRDNGTTWDLISGGGGGVNIYNSDGSLTGARTMTMANNNLTFDGGSNPARLIMSASNNITRSFAFATSGATRWAFTVDDNETGTNTGGNWYLRAYTDAGAFLFDPISVERATGEKSMIAIETLDSASDTLTGLYNITGGTYAAGLTMIGGNPHGASHNNYTLANAGNLTFANSIYLGAQSNVLRLQANNSGTITLSTASPGIRTAAATLNQIQYNTTTGAAITYTHASVMQTLGFYRLFAAGSLTVTNAYGLIVNDLNEYGYAATGGGALVLTNRWGIYQDSTTDVNYLGGTTLIGTTTNAGYKLDTGTLSARLGGIILQQNAPIVTGNNLFTTAANFAIGTASANTLFLCTNTIQRLAIDATGNVGIGTNTPSFKTQINATRNTSALELVMTDRTAVNDYTQIGFGFDPFPAVIMAAVRAIFVDPLSSFDSNLSFHTYSGSLTEKMRITPTGNVGIGTNNPIFARLQILTTGSGIVHQRATADFFYGTGFNGSNPYFTYYSANNFIIGYGTSTGGAPSVNAATFTTGGNVLIGSTTDPGAKLYVNGVTFINTTSSAGDYYLQVGGGIYATNNSVNLSIATQNNRFIAGEYGIGVGTGTFDASQTNGINVRSGTAPTTNVADVFVMYAADITAGNAAPHFRTENGNTVKIYQETTGVGSATFASPGAGSTVKTDDTFDGYTLQQVVKALRNLGILA